MSKQTYIFFGATMGITSYLLVSELFGSAAHNFPLLIYGVFLISLYRDRRNIN